MSQPKQPRKPDSRPSYAAAVHSPLAVVCATASRPASKSEEKVTIEPAVPDSQTVATASLRAKQPVKVQSELLDAGHVMTWPAHPAGRFSGKPIPPRVHCSSSDDDYLPASALGWKFPESGGDVDSLDHLLPPGARRREPGEAPGRAVGPVGEWAQMLRALFVVGLPMVARQLGALFSRHVLSRLFGRLRSY